MIGILLNLVGMLQIDVDSFTYSVSCHATIGFFWDGWDWWSMGGSTSLKIYDASINNNVFIFEHVFQIDWKYWKHVQLVKHTLKSFFQSPAAIGLEKQTKIINLPQQIQLKHLMCSFYCENAIRSYWESVVQFFAGIYDWGEVQCVGII